MKLKSVLLSIFAALAIVASSNAWAAGAGGCGAFDWPLDVELAWFADANVEHVSSGAALPGIPDKAIDLTLADAATITFPVSPGGKKGAADGKTFGGIVDIASVEKPGVYQVTMSGPGWIDVVQKGVALKAEAHTGMKDCPAIRKSVRFSITDGPVSLQFSGSPTASLTFAIRAAQ